MRTVMERIEISWWNFHLRVLDETSWLREALPEMKRIWEMREEALPYLAWSLLGFPLGMVLGLLSLMAR
jgi:hypothetical protein